MAARRPAAGCADWAVAESSPKGLEGNFWTDLYHNAMTASWPIFIAALAAAFVLLNAVFALVYDLGDQADRQRPRRVFEDLFFFSIETTLHRRLRRHASADRLRPLSSRRVENFVGLMVFAMMTGLVFARIARPRARIIFARHPVVCEHDGVPTLMFRMANARSNFISEATAKAWMIGPHSVHGKAGRSSGFHPLRLVKSENPDACAELGAVSPDRRRQSALRDGQPRTR